MAAWGAFVQKYCKRKIPEEFRKVSRKDFFSLCSRKVTEGFGKDSPEGLSSGLIGNRVSSNNHMIEKLSGKY